MSAQSALLYKGNSAEQQQTQVLKDMKQTNKQKEQGNSYEK